MAITRVQGLATSTGSNVTSFTSTITNGIKQGNLIIAAVATGNNTTNFTPPDTSWKLAAFNQPVGGSATIGTAIWYLVVDSQHAGLTTFTWRLSAAHSVFVCMEEWSAAYGWYDVPLDMVALGDTVAAPVAATIIDSGSTTPTSQAEELWVASLAYKGSAQAETSVTAGWTSDLEATQSTLNTETLLYQVTSTRGVANVNYTIGTAAFWAGCIATFRTRQEADWTLGPRWHRPRYIMRGVVGSIFTPFQAIPAWVDRSVTSRFVRQTSPVNVPRYVPRAFGSTLINYLLGMVIRFRLMSADMLNDAALRFILAGGVTQSIRDLVLRFRLGNLKDTNLRLRLGKLNDLVLRLRLRSANQLKDLVLRFLLGSLRDMVLRLRLGLLKDTLLRLNLGLLHDAVIRLRLGKLNDTVLRFVLIQLPSNQPRWTPRALAADLLRAYPSVPLPAWVRHGLTETIIRPTQPTNIPHYVRRSLTSLLSNYILGTVLRFRLGLVKDAVLRFRLMSASQLKDLTLRLRLGKLNDITLRFILTTAQTLKDTALRLRLKSADQLKDSFLRLRLGSVKDILLRFRLGSLKDAVLRFRLRSADQLKDLVLRLRLGSLRDAALRLRLGKLKDAQLRFILASVGQSVRDAALRFRLMSASILKDSVLRLRLGKLKDLVLRLSLAIRKDLPLRLRLGSVKDLALRFKLRSANILKDLVIRLRLGKTRDCVLRFILQSGAPVLPFSFADVTTSMLSFSETNTQAITQSRQAGLSYIPRVIQATIVRKVYSTIKEWFSWSTTQIPVLSTSESSKQALLFTHGIQVMPAPLTTILSTITVTDANGTLISNASIVTLTVTYPDLSTTALTLAGGGITNLGSGQYQAKYNTKMSGPTRELWNVTANDGVTIGSYQFEIGVGY